MIHLKLNSMNIIGFVNLEHHINTHPHTDQT